MYLSYEQYKAFGGSLDATSFGNYEFEARTIVDWYTFGRIPKWYKNETDYPENLARCMYQLIKLLLQLEEANMLGSGGSSSTQSSTSGVSGAIQSQSNDGVSISYNVVSASEKIANADKEKADIIRRYLGMVVDSLGRKLLYRGLYPGE